VRRPASEVQLATPPRLGWTAEAAGDGGCTTGGGVGMAEGRILLVGHEHDGSATDGAGLLLLLGEATTMGSGAGGSAKAKASDS
jgi:hypothetical protein